jgi:stress-induced morphogen
MDEAGGPVEAAMSSALASEFEPLHLEILNESSGHNVAKGSETHFKVIVVSSAFQGVALLERHRSVNACLAEFIAGPVHALSIVAKTPEQWAISSTVGKSPPCLGGGGK